MPFPQPIADEPTEGPGRGRAGDLAPPCAVLALGSLASFLGGRAAGFAPELQPLRVFKCRLMYLLVVPGIRDDEPKVIKAPKG